MLFMPVSLRFLPRQSHSLVRRPPSATFRITPSLWYLSLAAAPPRQQTVAFSSSAIMPPKPSLPLRYEAAVKTHLDLTDLSASINEAAASREQTYNISRQMKTSLIQIRENIGQGEAATGLKDFLATYSDYLPHDRQSLRTSGREANLSDRVSDTVQIAAYQHFLETGTLLPPVDWATDEEYLTGACMGLAQDLQKYGLGRATVRDVQSVQTACDLTAAILDYLLQFDFRNGPLRRKYDGIKYSLKALETLLYELAVTSSTDSEPETKRMKQADYSQLLPNQELQALRKRMEHRDELRENLIKKCRDGQKAAKQSIYALHRGDRNKAEHLLQDCAKLVKEQLLPIVEEEPTLRSGSFANVVEEYVEAKLFAVWLHGGSTAPSAMEEDGASPSRSGKASGILLNPEFFVEDILPLEPDEYIGGLCDLTGEVGRYAVHRGTERDVESVKLCLQANREIMKAVDMMERTLGGNKKLDPLRNSVSKIERMLYELSLSSAAGGRNVETHVEEMEKE